MPGVTTKPDRERSGRCVVGCVSFLNARPLIDGLDDHDELSVRYDVPSALLEDLTTRQVDLALCPVIDFQLSDEPLTIVPAGGIGCDGPTLTVRLFSRAPLEQVRHVRADTDSHTSVVLLQVVMHELYGRRLEVSPLDGRETRDYRDGPEALLLIGDKVVAASPPPEAYPYQLDLGSAWKTLTQLPFVFAVWMARPGEPLGGVPAILEAQRRANAARIDRIAASCADRHGWTPRLARHYLGDLLEYEITPRHLEAMERFWRRAAELGLVARRRPMAIYPHMQAAVD